MGEAIHSGERVTAAEHGRQLCARLARNPHRTPHEARAVLAARGGRVETTMLPVFACLRPRSQPF